MTYPKTETEAIMVGSTAEVDDEPEEDETDDGDDFDGC